MKGPKGCFFIIIFVSDPVTEQIDPIEILAAWQFILHDASVKIVYYICNLPKKNNM